MYIKHKINGGRLEKNACKCNVSHIRRKNAMFENKMLD